MKSKRFFKGMVVKRRGLAVLFASVVVIWGVVVYEFGQLLSTKVEQPINKLELQSLRQEMEDTLRLDYRDPFSPIEEVIRPNVGAMPENHQAPQIRMPELCYKGIIRGTDGIIKALVEYRGDVLMVSEGEMIGDAIVGRICSKSITVCIGSVKQDFESQ